MNNNNSVSFDPHKLKSLKIPGTFSEWVLDFTDAKGAKYSIYRGPLQPADSFSFNINNVLKLQNDNPNAFVFHFQPGLKMTVIVEFKASASMVLPSVNLYRSKIVVTTPNNSEVVVVKKIGMIIAISVIAIVLCFLSVMLLRKKF